ncbi:MAG TPA: hypothetical protein VGI43_17590 [Mucilaginibacter sp.]|jgi:hypothetical protein
MIIPTVSFFGWKLAQIHPDYGMVAYCQIAISVLNLIVKQVVYGK